MSEPTLPVTQTAASVTHEVTPRITKSAVACAAPFTALPTTEQIMSAPGMSHGVGIGPMPARAGGASGARLTDATSAATRVALRSRSDSVRSRLTAGELLEAGDSGEQI